MYQVEIRRPSIKDKEELNRFFSKVVHDTFAREGLAELHDDIESETESKKRYLEADFGSHGENRFFWIAEDQSNHRIVGTIEYGLASELIIKCTSGAMDGWFEIGTVFVHPDYQGRGIGTLLLNIMLLTLRNKGIEEFCLDSGYAHAQKVWKKKLGDPDYCLKDCWGKGADHMIWKRRTNDMPLIFTRVFRSLYFLISKEKRLSMHFLRRQTAFSGCFSCDIRKPRLTKPILSYILKKKPTAPG